MEACSRGHTDIVKILAASPNILNCRDKEGNTAAMLAVINQQKECVKVLSKIQGIDWNIADVHGKTPAVTAAQKNFVEILRILVNIPEVIVWTLYWSYRVLCNYHYRVLCNSIFYSLTEHLTLGGVLITL